MCTLACLYCGLVFEARKAEFRLEQCARTKCETSAQHFGTLAQAPEAALKAAKAEHRLERKLAHGACL